jgi:methylase of polypeptide subunit release factors
MDLVRDLGPRSLVLRKCLPTLIPLFTYPQYIATAESVLGEISSAKFARGETSLAALAQRIDARLTSFPALHFLWAIKLYYAIIVRGVVSHWTGVTANFLDRDFPTDWKILFQAASDAIFSVLEGTFSAEDAFPCSDHFQQFYQALIPRPVRHVLGEYYTPDWLVDHVLDQLPLETIPDVRLLDPACGSGAFLIGVIRRLRKLPHPETLLDRIRGIDVNPLAVLTARANLFMALSDIIDENKWTGPSPIVLGDSILGQLSSPVPEEVQGMRVSDLKNHQKLFWDDCSDRQRELPLVRETFDLIVGNPPWIVWDNLPTAYREATKPLWEQYGLFSLSASAARHGGGKKDLSMLMLYAAADRYLKTGGRLALVITQTLFQTQGAGDGFRRFQLGDRGEKLKVFRVDDFVEARPFGDAANWTSVIYLEKGATTQYPVTYFKWRGSVGKTATTGRGFREEFRAQPVDFQRPTSPWILHSAEQQAKPPSRIGPSQYLAYLGANSGGLNGVFWLEVLEKTAEGVRVRNVVEKGKRVVRAVEAILEPDLLFPLLRWGDLRSYAAAPRLAIVLVQDPERRRGLDETHLRQNFPRTYDYLRQFESLLRDRAAYRRYQSHGPFYSMYNVGPYTLAPVKVVWRRMDHRMTAAVAPSFDHPLLGRKPMIPQETCVLIPCATADEAHYLCALLNSAPIDSLIRSLSVRGGKGFGTPRVLDYLSLKQFDPSGVHHARLAALSHEIHHLQQTGKCFDKIQREIDILAEQSQQNDA